MEGYNKNNFKEKTKFLKEKIGRSFDIDKEINKKKKKIEKDLQKLQRQETVVRRKRTELIKKRDNIKEKVLLYEKKDAEIRASKKMIEEKEMKEKDPKNRKKIEERRWEIEEKRRVLEKEKWRLEDSIKELQVEIKDKEKEVTEIIRPAKKNLREIVVEQNIFLEKNLKERGFLKRKLISEKRKEQRRRKEEAEKKKVEEQKRLEEERKKIEEEKRRMEEKQRESEEERKIVEEIKNRARLLAEQIKRTEEEKKQTEEQKRLEEERKKIEEEKKRLEEEKTKKLEETQKESKKTETEREQKRINEEYDEKKSELEKKMDSILDVIKKNEEEISSLRSELAEKKSKSNLSDLNIEDSVDGNKKDLTSEESEKDQRQIDIIRERLKKEQAVDSKEKSPVITKIVQVEKQPTTSRTVEVTPSISSENSEEKSKMTYREAAALFRKGEESFNLGNFRMARERFQRVIDEYGRDGMHLDSESGKANSMKEKAKNYLHRAEEQLKKISEEDESSSTEQMDEDNNTQPQKPQFVVNLPEHMVVENKGKADFDTNNLEAEINRIISERQKVEEKKRELESAIISKEQNQKIVEKKEEEKNNLIKELEKSKSSEVKEEINRRIKEMEGDIRRLIEEETEKSWGKRFKNIETDIAKVNEKYQQLTQRERVLREKIEKINEWGPEKRKKEKNLISDYRSLYKIKKQNNLEDGKQGEELKGKREEGNLLKRIINYIKPSKDFSLGKPFFLAIDISDYSIKVFAINRQKEIKFYDNIELEEGVVYNGEIKDDAKLRDALFRLLEKNKLTNLEKNIRVKAILNLPESKIFVHQIKVNKKDNYIEKIKEKIKEKIPIDIDKLYFYYHTINLSPEKDKFLLFIAVEKEIVNQYINFLQSVDIDPIIFDIEAVSVGRALFSNNNQKEEKQKKKKNKQEKENNNNKQHIMIVDIGARITTINIFFDKKLSFSISTAFGGAYFTERISKELNISKKEAEEKKRSLGVSGEIKDILEDLLNKIILEIENVKNYYFNEFGESINKIIITGGDAVNKGVMDYFNEELEEEVEMGNPLKLLKKTEELAKEKYIIYSNVIGLALRSVEKNPINSGFNLLPEEIQRKEKRIQSERNMTIKIFTGVLITIAICLLAFSVYYYFYGF